MCCLLWMYRVSPLPAVVGGMEARTGSVTELTALRSHHVLPVWHCSPLASRGEFPRGPSVKGGSALRVPSGRARRES